MANIADRVKETSTTTGTGTLNLAGAVANFQGFVAGIGTGNLVYYSIVHQTLPEWEVGIGTVTDAAPDTLSRTTVLASSNAGALVSFSAGTKDVFATYPAGRAVLLDVANVFTANQTISNTAPSLILTDTTASAKSLTIAVDANLAQLRESAGASGSLLVLDLATNNVGIGTTNPGYLLDVSGNSRINGGGNALYLGNGGSYVGSDAGGQSVYLKASGGNQYFWTGSGYNMTLGVNGLSINNGSAEPTTGNGLIVGSGNVGIGTTTFGTSAVKVLGLGNGTAPTTSPANMVQVWAEDIAASSELRVRDEAGNVTTLSPHPAVFLDTLPSNSPLPWAYRSHNEYVGQEVMVDMAGLVAEVERLSGKTFATYRAIPKRDWRADQDVQVAARDAEIAAATKRKADLVAEAEQETDSAKKIEKQKQADDMTIPAAYVAKRPPIWMQRRGITSN